MLHQQGVEVKGKLLDTMIAHYLLSPDGRHGAGLSVRNVSRLYPGSIETLIGKKGKQGTLRDVRER